VCVKLYGGHPRYEVAHPKPRLWRRTMTPVNGFEWLARGITYRLSIRAMCKTTSSRSAVVNDAPGIALICMGALKLEAQDGERTTRK
jgi:hypothetical protein